MTQLFFSFVSKNTSKFIFRKMESPSHSEESLVRPEEINKKKGSHYEAPAQKKLIEKRKSNNEEELKILDQKSKLKELKKRHGLDRLFKSDKSMFIGSDDLGPEDLRKEITKGIEKKIEIFISKKAYLETQSLDQQIEFLQETEEGQIKRLDKEFKKGGVIKKLEECFHSSEHEVTSPEFKKEFYRILNKNEVPKEKQDHIYLSYTIEIEKLNTKGYIETGIEAAKEGVSEEELEKRLEEVIEANGSDELKELIETWEYQESLVVSEEEQAVTDLKNALPDDMEEKIEELYSSIKSNGLGFSKIKQGEDGMYFFPAYAGTQKGAQFLVNICVYPDGTIYLLDKNSDDKKGRKLNTLDEFSNILRLTTYDSILNRIGRREGASANEIITDEKLSEFITVFEGSFSSSANPELVFESMCEDISTEAGDFNMGEAFQDRFFKNGRLLRKKVIDYVRKTEHERKFDHKNTEEHHS